MKIYVLLEESCPICCATSYEDIIDYQIREKHITEDTLMWDGEICKWVPICHMFTQITDDWVDGIKLAGIDNYNDIFGEVCNYYIHESELITP